MALPVPVSDLSVVPFTATTAVAPDAVVSHAAEYRIASLAAATRAPLA